MKDGKNRRKKVYMYLGCRRNSEEGITKIGEKLMKKDRKYEEKRKKD